MNHTRDLFLTALAPTIWGSSYIVTTQFLPNLDPLTVSLLRALPAGLLLLLVVRQLPHGIWVPRMAVLGILNFSVFWSLLFLAAYRLPGGVAAVLGALQPLIVTFAARWLLGAPVRALAVAAAMAGVAGVALLVLSPAAGLDPLGVAAGLLASASMAFGTVLSRKWQPPVPALTFTAWQLTAGGLFLVPAALFAPTSWMGFTWDNVLGLAYLGLVGAAATYAVWFWGVARLQPTAVSLLAFLSPLSAALLGWIFLGETLTPFQTLGAIIVLVSLFVGQHAMRPGKSSARRNGKSSTLPHPATEPARNS